MRKLLGTLTLGAALAVGAVAGFVVPIPWTGNGTQTYEGTVDTAALPQASAELQVEDGEVTLVAEKLPQPDGVYQAWLKRPGVDAPEPSVAFEPRDGWAEVELAGDIDLEDLEAVLLTREPNASSDSPSEEPVVVIVLTSATEEQPT